MSWIGVMRSYSRWRRIGRERSAKTRASRRRVLLRHGALLHAQMRTSAESSSLAMLDQDGVVVSWYDRSDANYRGAHHVIDRHVSQFYVPGDLKCRQPLLDLQAATAEGRNIRQGWRRRSDGTDFWGTTVIAPVRIRDGRLQGFSYVTSEDEGPSAQLPTDRRLDLLRDEAAGLGNSGLREAKVLPAWDRAARSRGGASQRRLFRLWCRLRTPKSEIAP